MLTKTTMTDDRRLCPSCNGEGRFQRFTHFSRHDGSADGYTEPCRDCEGTGGILVAPYQTPPCASIDGHRWRLITDDIYRCVNCGAEENR